VLSNDLFDASEFFSAEPFGTCKSDVSELEFGDASVTSNVNMWWLPQLVGIEEEAIRTDDLDRR